MPHAYPTFLKYTLQSTLKGLPKAIIVYIHIFVYITLSKLSQIYNFAASLLQVSRHKYGVT